jgi:hypothetical protein
MGSHVWVWRYFSREVNVSVLAFILSTALMVGACSTSTTFKLLDAGDSASTSTVCEGGGCKDAKPSNPSDAAGSGGASGVCDGGACLDQMRDATAEGEGGGQGEQDAAVVVSDGNAGSSPPEYCVAPCIWEVIKQCIPDFRQCVRPEKPNDYRLSLQEVICDPSTGWYTSSFVWIGKYTLDVGRNYHPCISFNRMGSTILFFDSTGMSIAYIELSPSRTAYCGDILGFEWTDDGVELADDGGFVPAYHLEPDRAECAAWDEYGFPVGSIPDNDACIIADAGACGFEEP